MTHLRRHLPSLTRRAIAICVGIILLVAAGVQLCGFPHLYDQAGGLVAQGDGYPLMGASLPTYWRPGDVWRDLRALALPPGLAAGQYTIKVGLYPVDGGPRPIASDPAGQRLGDDAVPLGTLTLP